MNNNKTGIHYIPVKYKKTWLSPCRISRAKKLVQRGEAIWFKDKLLGTCIRLKKEPSDYVLYSGYTLGIDKGTMYDGFSLVSDQGAIHFQLNHTKIIKNKNCIKEAVSLKNTYKRLRRSRLRHRKARFSNRIGKKLSKTALYYLQHFKNIVIKLSNAYHFTAAIMEDVRFNHYVNPNGKSFSNIEIGKTKQQELLSSLCSEVYFVAGIITKRLRLAYYLQDPKLKDKGGVSFYAHCVDSNVLASSFRSYSHNHTELVNMIYRDKPIVRRKITKFNSKQGLAKYYFRYLKGGIKQYFTKYSRLVKVRVKINDSKSNHGPWRYKFLPRIECLKSVYVSYGGRCWRSNKRGNTEGGVKVYDSQNMNYKYFERVLER